MIPKEITPSLNTNPSTTKLIPNTSMIFSSFPKKSSEIMTRALYVNYIKYKIILYNSRFFMHLSYKLEKCIIWSYLIEDFFATCFTLMDDHISLIFPIVYPDRTHESMAGRETISWERIIDMFRIETHWAVIACRTCRMRTDFPATFFTDKWLISHDKTHIFR